MKTERMIYLLQRQPFDPIMFKFVFNRGVHGVEHVMGIKSGEVMVIGDLFERMESALDKLASTQGEQDD